MCVSILCTVFVWNVFHPKKMSARCDKKYICLLVKYTLFYQILMKLLFSKTCFRETLIYKISWQSVHWNLSFSIRTVGQTDGRTDLKNLIMAQLNKQPTSCNNNGFLMISISSTCFGRRFRPSSGALDSVYSLWYNALAMLPAWQAVGCLFYCISDALSH